MIEEATSRPLFGERKKNDNNELCRLHCTVLTQEGCLRVKALVAHQLHIHASMDADFQVIFYLHHKNMLYEINTIDRRKGSFVWLYSFNVGGSLGRTNWQFVTQQLAQSGQGH